MKGLSGAETLLRVLRAMGVERIFASPGSDWAPLWEALAKLHWPDVPEYLSTRHEETAVGMATGYAKATGKLPAVVLHTTVGALHATMGVRAALHERIPMVVLAGESIGFAEGTHSVMGRQWLRLLTDVGGPARLMEHCVKWSFGLNTSVILPHTVQRACQLAMAAPKGPVFVSVPTEFLMEAMSADAPAAVLAVPPAAQPAAIEELARVLSEARNPVIVTEFNPWLQSLSCWARRCSMRGSPTTSIFRATILSTAAWSPRTWERCCARRTWCFSSRRWRRGIRRRRFPGRARGSPSWARNRCTPTCPSGGFGLT